MWDTIRPRVDHFGGSTLGLRSTSPYQHHKARNKGKVRVKGWDHYFPGKYDSPESREAYRELVAKMRAEYQQKVARGRGEEFSRANA